MLGLSPKSIHCFSKRPTNSLKITGSEPRCLEALGPVRAIQIAAPEHFVLVVREPAQGRVGTGFRSGDGSDLTGPKRGIPYIRMRSRPV